MEKLRVVSEGGWRFVFLAGGAQPDSWALNLC